MPADEREQLQSSVLVPTLPPPSPPCLLPCPVQGRLDTVQAAEVVFRVGVQGAPVLLLVCRAAVFRSPEGTDYCH